MLAIQEELKKENDVPYKEDDAMTFGFMFFRVIKGTISFPNPSCHMIIIEQRLPGYFPEDLKGPYII